MRCRMVPWFINTERGGMDEAWDGTDKGVQDLELEQTWWALWKEDNHKSESNSSDKKANWKTFQ